MANRFAEIEREEEAKATGGLDNFGVVPVPAPGAPPPRNRFEVIEEEEAAKTTAITPAATPLPSAPARAKTPLMTAVGRSVAEVVPFAPQLASISEKDITEARQDRPVVTGLTRAAATLGEYAGAARLGGPVGVGGLSALQEASALQREGKLDLTDPTTYAKLAAAGVLGAAGGKLLSKLPGVVQGALPVALGGAQWLGAKDESARAEALANLVPAATVSGAQAARGVKRFLSSRGERAGEQLVSTKGAELSAAREAELTEAQKAVASKLGERRALTGEQQSRLSKILELLRLGKQAGMTDLPSEESLLTPEGGWSSEALDEARKAVRSFIVNSPEKFTSEPARVAAALEAALAEQQLAEAKWANPLAVAEGMRPPAPVTPGPVPPELQAAARLLQQREIEAARARVSEELKTAAKNRALAVGLAGGVGSLFGSRVTPIALGTAGSVATYGAIRRLQQLLATDPKTKLFKDPAAANVVYDVIPSIVRKFPSMAKYASLVTDAGVRARPVFLLEALRRDPDFARAVEEEVTGGVSEE